MTASKRVYVPLADTFNTAFVHAVEVYASGDEGTGMALYTALSQIVSETKTILKQDNIHFDSVKFDEAVFGEGDYVYGVWHGGNSYSVVDFMDGMERWNNLGDAKWALKNRYSGGTYEAKVDGSHRILPDKWVETPATDETSYIDLYHAWRDPLELRLSDYPYKRLSFGPRMGVREESM